MFLAFKEKTTKNWNKRKFSFIVLPPKDVAWIIFHSNHIFHILKPRSSCVFICLVLNKKDFTASCPPTAAPSARSRASTSGWGRAAPESNDSTASEGWGRQETSGTPGSARPTAGGERARGAGGGPEKEGAVGADGEGQGAACQPLWHGRPSLRLPGEYRTTAEPGWTGTRWFRGAFKLLNPSEQWCSSQSQIWEAKSTQ